MKKINILGEIKINKRGEKIEIVEYVNSNNISVKFENGYIVKNRTYSHFKLDKVLSPKCKTVCGIGYLDGEYNVKYIKSYNYWQHMIKRCYSKVSLSKGTSYIGCSVCEEWQSFKNFKEWFDKNYYEVNGEQSHLDKDVLIKGNKIYSPETCIIVPQSINSLFIKRNIKRGKYPIGVRFNSKENKFMTQCQIGTGIPKTLGRFNNPIDAFYCYKKFKEAYIKEIAQKFKNTIPANCYEAMMKYEVEITD